MVVSAKESGRYKGGVFIPSEKKDMKNMQSMDLWKAATLCPLSVCVPADVCPYAHSEGEAEQRYRELRLWNRQQDKRYKSKQCRAHKKGICSGGIRCKFAHGDHDVIGSESDSQKLVKFADMPNTDIICEWMFKDSCWQGIKVFRPQGPGDGTFWQVLRP